MKIITTIILILGGLNWLSIGFLQYDYVAGLFGTQSHIFSRLVYIAIGLSAIYFAFYILKNKGRVNIFALSKKKKTEHNKENNCTEHNTEQDCKQQITSNFNKND